MLCKAIGAVPVPRTDDWLVPAFYESGNHPENGQGTFMCSSKQMGSCLGEATYTTSSRSRPPRPSRSRATTARPTTTATRARTRARRATTASCRRRSTTARRAGPTRGATHERLASQDEGRLGRARAEHEPYWQFGDAAPVPADSVDDATLMCASPPLDASVRSDDLSVAPCATPRCAVR